MRSIFTNAAVFLCTLLLIDAASYGIGVYLKRRGVFYNIPQVENYDRYLADRHPELGWPSQSFSKRSLDASGSRPIPAFPEIGNACVSLYGDSFTWSDHASDSEAWSNTMSINLSCRVANYGVSGYGTDQMLIRFQSNLQDEAPVVVLNHFSGDIRRNVNQLRNLMAESDSEYILLKPRYELRDGILTLVPLPTVRREQASELARYPERFLHSEYYVPDGPSGVTRLEFPYVVALAKALKNEHVRAKLGQRPVWHNFYLNEHPSGALSLTAAIMEEFNRTASARGKIAVITIIANVHDIHFFQAQGRWPYQPLIDELQRRGLRVLNIGAEFHKRLGTRDPCEVTSESCYGHFNREGYDWIGQIVGRYLTGEGLLQPSVGGPTLRTSRGL